MALFLDDNQARLVDLKKKTDRPEYYNSVQREKVTISEDFEAFLILQGTKNQDTTTWLTQSAEMGIRDGDRDALAHLALMRDRQDAFFSELEIRPIIDLFDRFRAGYNIQNFEQVAECGLLMDDLQRQMRETQNIMARLKHRQNIARLSVQVLGENGMDADKEQQLNSWFVPLATY